MAYSEKLQGEWRVIEEKCKLSYPFRSFYPFYHIIYFSVLTGIAITGSGDETLWGGYQRVMRKDGFVRILLLLHSMFLLITRLPQKCWRTIIRYNQMTECQIQAVRSEFGTLMSIRHPNLSDHYSWAHDRQNREIYMYVHSDLGILNQPNNFSDAGCVKTIVSIPWRIILGVAAIIGSPFPKKSSGKLRCKFSRGCSLATISSILLLLILGMQMVPNFARSCR